MLSASYLLESHSLLQALGLRLARPLQLCPAALQLLALLQDARGLGVPRGCKALSGTQHPLHLSLVGFHFRPELLPQNRRRGRYLQESLGHSGARNRAVDAAPGPTGAELLGRE